MSTETQDPRGELACHRRTIDNLDAAIVCILAERFRVTHRVGELKRGADMPPADFQREQQQIERLHSLARDAGLEEGVVDVVFPAIMTEVRRRHSRMQGCDS